MSGLGCDYWAITDHSRASFQANGLDEARLRKQIAEVARVNQQLEADGNPFRLLSGIEVDILKTKLDFDDTLLAELDVVVASLHVAGSNEADNTSRLIAASENPNVHMLGHLTGRLLLRQPARRHRRLRRDRHLARAQRQPVPFRPRLAPVAARQD